jgi:hypothetical protein
MRIIKEGIIFADNDPQSSTRVACFPSIARLSDGRILCTFRVGSTKESANETLRIAQSTDDGHTWQLTSFKPRTNLNGVPGSLRFAHLIETRPNHFLLASTWVNREDPNLPVAHPETGGCLELKLVVFRSSDGGRTWSDGQEVNSIPFEQPEISGPIVALAEAGHFLLPMENQKQFEDPEPIDEKCYALLSYDYGETWPEWAMIVHVPGRSHWCNRFARLPDSGNLIGSSWTYDVAAEQDLPIHILRGSPDAKQWEAPVSSGIEGQLSTIFPLSESTLLFGYVHRHQPASIRVRASTDGGHSWDASEELVLYSAEQDAPTDGLGGDIADYYQWMTNYTSGWNPMVRLRDGSVLIVYFAGTTETTSIRYAQITPALDVANYSRGI